MHKNVIKKIEYFSCQQPFSSQLRKDIIVKGLGSANQQCQLLCTVHVAQKVLCFCEQK